MTSRMCLFLLPTSNMHAQTTTSTNLQHQLNVPHTNGGNCHRHRWLATPTNMRRQIHCHKGCRGHYPAVTAAACSYARWISMRCCQWYHAAPRKEPCACHSAPAAVQHGKDKHYSIPRQRALCPAHKQVTPNTRSPVNRHTTQHAPLL